MKRCVVRRMVQALPHLLKMVGGTPRVPRRRNTKDQGEHKIVKNNTLKPSFILTFGLTTKKKETITYLCHYHFE